MASSAFSQRISLSLIACRLLQLKNVRFANLSKNLWPKRVAIYSWYIFISYTTLQRNKTDLHFYSSFFRIKSLRACWIVLQRWAWGRQRGVASFISLVPFSFPISAPSRTNLKILERDLKKKERKKDKLPRYSEYPKIYPIFISSCLVCARACYTSHPSTPTHGKHFFIYFNIFSFLSFCLLLLRLA